MVQKGQNSVYSVIEWPWSSIIEAPIKKILDSFKTDLKFKILTSLTIVQALLLKYRNGHNLAHKNRHLYFKVRAKTHWVQLRIYKRFWASFFSWSMKRSFSIGNSCKVYPFLFVLKRVVKFLLLNLTTFNRFFPFEKYIYSVVQKRKGIFSQTVHFYWNFFALMFDINEDIS